MNLRRLAALATIAVASLLTIATSPPVQPVAGLQASSAGQEVLAPAHPRTTLHYTAHLTAEANGAVPDGGLPLQVTLQASASGCLIGIDTFDDAGVCQAVSSFDARPSLDVALLSDGKGPVDANLSAMSIPLFEGCAVGSPCEQGFTLTVSLAPGEARAIVARWSLEAAAHGGVLEPVPVGASLTITQP